MSEEIAEPQALIDSAHLRAELSALYLAHGKSDTRLREHLLDHLKQVVANGRAEAERRLEEDGGGTACAENISFLQDELIRVIYDFTVTHVYRAMNPSAAERIAVVAVGGYGRGTLAPGSDIDLLFVLPYKQTAWGESVVEYMLYILWDLGFKVGHATRSVGESIRLSKSDFTIRTATLEARFIWGDRSLYDDMWARFEKEIIGPHAREFIAAKLAERDERHDRAGRSRYLVEPNVKDGKGGLRDLHTLFWIGKYVYAVKSAAQLVEAGVFTGGEYRRFRRCEDFLWAVRCHLHFMTGRAEDRLPFDLQPELAKRLGYTERGRLRAVERFMKHYFLMAKAVGDLTRIFCAVLEAQQMKDAPVLGRLFDRLRRRTPEKFDETDDFIIVQGRISVANDEVFKTDPVNLIRIFHLAETHKLQFQPAALKLITRSLRLIDGKLRKNPEANRLLLGIMTSPTHPEETLRKMNEAGVLGRFVRAFGKIVALMQFNMYHHYTVDEHLLRAIGILSEIEHGDLGDEHPLSDELIHNIRHRRALYVAVFLHDIAKGRQESHSIAGARVARRFCPRLGLSPAETETVAWLVEHHLVMSDFAQMRDLNDFKTILDFAAIVQSPERLKLLLILTVADIKAVGPGVWNGWKGQLLRNLYYETEPVLAGGHTAVTRAQRIAEAKAAFADRVEGWDEARLEAYFARHYPAYWLSAGLDRQLQHAGLIEKAGAHPFVTAVKTDRFTAITELTVYVPDHPRLLSILTGACAVADANIVDAQIFTTVDGLALDTIFIQREFDDEADERRRAERIVSTIAKGLKGEIRLPEAVAGRAGRSDRLKAFSVEPQVFIDNEISNIFTVIEVNGLDRTGLLYDLTSALHQLSINIRSAHIATFGERAVDVFYVTDLTGQKIVSESRQERISDILLAALEGAPGEAAKAAKSGRIDRIRKPGKARKLKKHGKVAKAPKPGKPAKPAKPGKHGDSRAKPGKMPVN